MWWGIDHDRYNSTESDGSFWSGTLYESASSRVAKDPNVGTGTWSELVLPAPSKATHEDEAVFGMLSDLLKKGDNAVVVEVQYGDGRVEDATFKLRCGATNPYRAPYDKIHGARLDTVKWPAIEPALRKFTAIARKVVAANLTEASVHLLAVAVTKENIFDFATRDACNHKDPCLRELEVEYAYKIGSRCYVNTTVLEQRYDNNAASGDHDDDDWRDDPIEGLLDHDHVEIRCSELEHAKH